MISSSTCLTRSSNSPRYFAGLWGIDERGQLTVRERRCPRCAILLDAIEKAHPDVDKVLLQFFPPIRALDIAPRGLYCPTT